VKGIHIFISERNRDDLSDTDGLSEEEVGGGIVVGNEISVQVSHTEAESPFSSGDKCFLSIT